MVACSTRVGSTENATRRTGEKIASTGITPDGRRALVALRRQVAAALLDGEVDGEAALGVDRREVELGVEDLDVGGGLDVAGGDLTRAARVEAQRDRLLGRAA